MIQNYLKSDALIQKVNSSAVIDVLNSADRSSKFVNSVSPGSSRPYLPFASQKPVIEPNSDKLFGTQKRFFKQTPTYSTKVPHFYEKQYSSLNKSRFSVDVSRYGNQTGSPF